MTILDRIVADTRELVARRRKEAPAGSLEKMPGFGTPTRPLGTALRGPDLSVIAEIKRASPSKGVIRDPIDPAGVARAYTEAGAAAISVLTEPFHFRGSLDDLALARTETRLPILRKDFVVDPYQLVEARAYGADAVLLVAAVLDRRQLYDLHQAASDLGLSCLVEVYDPSELAHIDLDQVSILGVNNRDLRTFEVDIEHSLRVFSQVPRDVIRISESGLRTPSDLAHLRRNGVDAVLIGETFMRAPEPGRRLADLRARVRVRLDEPVEDNPA